MGGQAMRIQTMLRLTWSRFPQSHPLKVEGKKGGLTGGTGTSRERHRHQSQSCLARSQPIPEEPVLFASDDEACGGATAVCHFLQSNSGTIIVALSFWEGEGPGLLFTSISRANLMGSTCRSFALQESSRSTRTSRRSCWLQMRTKARVGRRSRTWPRRGSFVPGLMPP